MNRREIAKANIPYVKAMIKQLKDFGAMEVRISFDGAGDSGSIEEVSVWKGQERLKPLFDVEYMVSTGAWNSDTGKWEETANVKSMIVCDALEQFCYDKLEETGIDWYNNDGGYGELTINIGDDIEVNLEVHTRYTETTSDSFDLSEELSDEE